jgi:hypothetical protein
LKRASLALGLVIGFGAVVLASACSAVLGFESLSPYPAEAGPVADGPTGGGNGDAPANVPDTGTDAPACGSDLTKDSKNCGRCGHDCLGGDCTDSQCQPIRLADGLAFPEGLAVNDTSVFVAEMDQNRILKFGKTELSLCVTAPPPPSCIAGDELNNVVQPAAVAVDGTRFYWANSGGSFGPDEVRSCPLNGCVAQTGTLIAALADGAFNNDFGDDELPLNLVVTGGQVFWPENESGAIRSAPVAGGGPVTTYLDNAGFAPVAIAVDDTRIYFTDDTNQHEAEIESVPRIGSIPDGGSRAVVARPGAHPWDIDLTATGSLYWTIPGVTGDGLVQAIAKTSDGGIPVGGIAASQPNPAALLVDDKNVYWLLPGADDTATGKVVYCPLSGCPTAGPTVLAQGQKRPKHIAQDAQAIYWSSIGLASVTDYDGQVWKVAKP